LAVIVDVKSLNMVGLPDHGAVMPWRLGIVLLVFFLAFHFLGPVISGSRPSLLHMVDGLVLQSILTFKLSGVFIILVHEHAAVVNHIFLFFVFARVLETAVAIFTSLATVVFVNWALPVDFFHNGRATLLGRQVLLCAIFKRSKFKLIIRISRLSLLK